MKSKKLSVINNMRFFAFMNIYILHAEAYQWLDVKYSAAGAVSFFIILSGFMYGYKIEETKEDITFAHFGKKVLSIYLLHFVSTLFIAYYYFDLKKLIIHLLLLQSYVNDDTIYLGLNAPSWFLSTYVFLQLMLIPITRILRKVKNKKVFFFIFITIFALNAIYINVIHNLNYDITYWLYVFPPARLPEFICGIVTGMVFSKNKSEDFLCDSKKIKKYTIVELICVFLLLALIYIVNLETIFEPWMSRTEFWILPLTFIIYVFANEKGYISNILKASCFEKLSSISHECFMLHIPVVCVFNMLNLMWASRRIRFIIWWAILFTTICVSVIWKYLYGLIKSKKYAEFKDAKFRNRVDKSDKR